MEMKSNALPAFIGNVRKLMNGKKVPEAQSDDFTHASLPSNSRAIRLLYLEPSFVRSSEIRVRLQDVILGEHPKFKALSYVWGDPSVTLPIMVGGKRYFVTTNCHAALRRLREVRGKWLWIDAICINQGDITEKGIQIPLMRDIYSFAVEVIVWLGHGEADRTPEDEDNEKLAFSLMNELDHKIRDPSDAGRAKTVLSDIMQRRDFHRRIAAFAKLLSHPWFGRLWVHQEILVSSAARVLCQYRLEPFSRLVNVGLIIKNLTEGGVASEALPFLYGGIESSALRESLAEGIGRLFLRATDILLYNKQERSFADGDLVSLLGQHRAYQCTDARDRVFAILNIVKHDGLNRTRVDYSQSVAAVYSSLTKNIIEEDQSLQILRLAGCENCKTINLPSWAANLIPANGLPPTALLQLRYMATLETSPQVLIDDTLVSMEARGYFIDRVILLNHAPFEENRESWLNGSIGLPEWWKRFDNYPTGCEPHEAYIRTITTDFELIGGHYSRLSLFKINQYHAITFSKVEERLWNFATTLEGKATEWGIEMLEMKAIEVLSEYERNVQVYSYGKAFFISNLGYMGIGPVTARQDDMVCLLLGSKVPFLIRKEDDHHILIGECFVWGLMDGEGMKNRNEDDEMEIFRLQ